jgi:hypothetical protein
MNSRFSTIAARACRYGAVTCFAALSIGTVRALPLDPGVTRELNFLSQYSMCTGNPGTVHMSCVLTNGDSLSPAFTDDYGAPASGSAHIFYNGVNMALRASTNKFSAPYAYFDAVQFDQLTITGPTSRVNVGVTVTINGSTAQSASGYVLSNYSFIEGVRSATPNPSANSMGDRINNDGARSVLAYAYTGTLGRGIIEPATSRTEVGSFSAGVGSPFERGFEFVLDAMNTTMDFSVRVDYTVPDGYVLTSARALAAVPEPESGTMLLAGLGLIGWLAGRRNARTASHPGNLLRT